MYRYSCVVHENVGKNVFNDTVAEIKSLYHGSVEIPHMEFSNSEIGQVLNIFYRPGEEAKVCVKYEYDKMRVVVLSEVYLGKIFEGEIVEEISLQIRDNADKDQERILSFGFLIVNIIVSLFAFEYVFESGANAIFSVILAVIYIITAYKIKYDKDIPYFRILAMQFGGNFTIPITILLFALPFMAFTNDNDSSGGLYLIIMEILYFKIVIPALIISGIAYAVLPLFETTDDEASLKDKIFTTIKNFFDRSTSQGVSFYGLAIVLAIISLFTNEFTFGDISLELMVYFVLILIYTISAVMIKRKNDISLFKILFMQSGEYIALAFFIVLASFFSVGFELNGTEEQIGGISVYALMLLVEFYKIVIPTLAISGIITFILEAVNQSREE